MRSTDMRSGGVAATACAGAAIAIVAATAACSGDADGFADWTVAVPNDVRIVQYPAVPLAARTREIEVLADLAIGNEDDPDYRFFRAVGIGVDGDDNIYVFDSGNHRIQAFDPQGNLMRTIGALGSGPGELSGDGGLFAVGNDSVIHASRYSRLSIWSRRGESRFSGQAGSSAPHWDLATTDSGRMIAIQTDRLADQPRNRSVGRLTPDGTKAFAALGKTSPLMVQRTRGGRVSGYNTFIPVPEADMTVDKRGSVYFTPGAEYQVFSMSDAGEWNWALRVAWDRLRLDDAAIETSLERLRKRLPDARRTEVEWPDELPALSVASKSVSTWHRGHPLRVDGAGYLYVFPFTSEDSAPWEERERHRLRPVDVYTPTGERVFAGLMREISWGDARGDFIYGLEFDPATDEQRAVRYRVVRPWE